MSKATHKDIKVYFHQGLLHLGWIDHDRWGLGGSVGTRGARKLRRCLKVTEDQERQTEAASEAKYRQMKQGWRRDTEMTRMDAGG